MKLAKIRFQHLLFIVLWGYNASLFAQVDYPLTEDSKLQQEVPQGTIKGPFRWESKVYPGTTREFWVYIPKQYNARKPTCLMVTFDGYGLAKRWNIPTVLDNLIHQGQVPTTIGVFIHPGVLPSLLDDTYDRPNRSIEYDSRGSKIAALVIDEVLPLVEKDFNISKDPNDRLIAGNSSGGNAALNVAWERPDVFRRVYSGIGSFTGLRGGHDFAVLIRKTEPKPIRIFLQDGKNDLNNFSGEWWMANQYMLSSLQWAGYEVNYAWGEDKHSYRHGASLMPEILKWLWKDYPQPVGNTKGQDREKNILSPNSQWETLFTNTKGIQALTSNAKGKVFFLNADGTIIYSTGGTAVYSIWKENKIPMSGLAVMPDQRLCSCLPSKNQIVAFNANQQMSVLFDQVHCTDLLATNKGIYFVAQSLGVVGFAQYKSQEVTTYPIGGHPSGISVSAEQSFINITDYYSPDGQTAQIDSTGRLHHFQPFFYYHLPYQTTTSGAMGMYVDIENQTYTATKLGIQVSDQLGRCRLILPIPGAGPIEDITFDGLGRNILYATNGKSLYKRSFFYNGAHSWDKPIRPTKPVHVKKLK